MTPKEKLETFWAHDCGVRGPALSHTHGECADPQKRIHAECPCKDCGLTPQRWLAMVEPTIKQIPAPPSDDDEPLQLPQPGELGVPIQERRATTLAHRENRYREWSPSMNDYVNGDPHGVGRGDLSPAWVEWALHYEWLT